MQTYRRKLKLKWVPERISKDFFVYSLDVTSRKFKISVQTRICPRVPLKNEYISLKNVFSVYSVFL
jgi:hypothetical protein